MEKEMTVAYKSKKFAVRIVKLYRYLNDEKKNLFFQNSYSAAVRVSELILPKANVLSARRISFPKLI